MVKKQLAKAVSFVLCAMMLASFVACSNGKSTTGSTSISTALSTAEAPSTAAASTSKPDPFGKYSPTITLTTARGLDSYVKFDSTKPTQKSLTENIWATSYEEQLGIKFNYIWTPNSDQYNAKWNVSIAANDIPDIAEVDGTIYKQLVDSGLVEDMTQYYKDYASDVYKKANVDDGGLTMKYMTFSGKLLGLPENGSQPDNANFMFIRKDWLKKVNMTEPKTIDELIKVAEAFKAAKLGGEGTYGICIGKQINGGQNDLAGLLNGFKAYYDIWMQNSSGNLVYSSIQPEMRTALLKIQQMYKSGLFSPDFAVKDNSKVGEDIAAGKVGISFGIFWAPYGSMLTSIAQDKTSDWEVVTPPTSDGSTFVSQASAAPGSYLYVKKGMKNPEAAVKVLNLNLKLAIESPNTYVTTPDTQNPIEVFKYRVGMNIWPPWKNANTYQAVANAFDTGDVSKLIPEQSKVYDNIKSALTGNRDKVCDILVFGKNGTFNHVFDYKNNNQLLIDADQTLPTETQSTSATLLKTSLDATIFKIIMGDDISTFDKAVSAWKQGGGDKITEEINSWYEANK